MATTAGTDWEIVSQPLHHVGGHFYAFFLLYIAFFLFVIMNTLTSLFVETTILHADRDQAQIIQQELERKEEYVAKLKAFFHELDDDQSGHVKYEAFRQRANDPRMHAFAQ